MTNLNAETKARAPKGGVTIANVFYHGGQFLPSNDEPKRGAYNRKNYTKSALNKELKATKSAQYQIVRTAYVNRIMGMDKVWNSPRMTVTKSHPYAYSHAIQTFEWHQRFGW